VSEIQTLCTGSILVSPMVLYLQQWCSIYNSENVVQAEDLSQISLKIRFFSRISGEENAVRVHGGGHGSSRGVAWRSKGQRERVTIWV
jgi:hypothetical protein